MGMVPVDSAGGLRASNQPSMGLAVNGLAATIREIDQYLMGVQDWVLKSKEGLTREQARRIFQRYHSPGQKDPSLEATEESPSAQGSAPDRQTHQIQQILHYMEQTTQRLDLIENDIGYIKEKVDAILKRL